MSVHMLRDLESLHRNLLTMCADVEMLVTSAVEILRTPEFDRASELADRDDAINAMDVRIEEECLKLLALHQPVAIDLRRIATVMRISGELERVADLGVSIAKRACGIALSHNIAVPDRLLEMSRMALGMLHRSIDCYVQLDVRAARDVCLKDDEVDRLNREIIDELMDVMRSNPVLVEPAVHLFSASRQIERVADHATNIAEEVVYLVEGEIIRHRSRNRN